MTLSWVWRSGSRSGWYELPSILEFLLCGSGPTFLVRGSSVAAHGHAAPSADSRISG